MLRIAGALARSSLHPASLAIAAETKRRGINGVAAAGARVHPGLGVSGTVDGRPAAMGSPRFVAGPEAATADAPAAGGAAGEVLVSWDGRLAGSISLRESVRPEAREALARLGFRSEVLTGDHPRRGAALAEALGVPVRAGLLPLEKVSRIEDLSRAGGVVAMVGDGINDTPALAASTVGIAMGSGVDLARAAADVILLGGPAGPSLEALPRLVELSRRTIRRIRWNLFWAFAYNTVAMALAACGMLSPAFAAALMVVSSLFVVAGSAAIRRTMTYWDRLSGLP